VTNILTYSDSETITAVKSFIILPAGVNVEMAKYYMYIDEISQNEFLVDPMSLDELPVD
jgi:hypothetical protein